MIIAQPISLRGAIYVPSNRSWFPSPSAAQKAATIPLPAQRAVTTQPTRALTYAEQLAAAQAKAAEMRRAEAERQAAIQAEGQRRLQEIRAASDAAIRKAAAEREAKRQAEAARAARIPQTPQNGGMREWERYYQQQGASMPATVRGTLERKEQLEFARQTAGKKWITDELGRAAGVGVSGGVGWMFSVAYQGKTMPYWGLWYDRKATADQIARMVAEDYKSEIMRRVKAQTAYRRQREAWQDAGKLGPPPFISPDAGAQPERRAMVLPSVQQAPRMALPEPRTTPSTRPARPTAQGGPPPLIF